MNKKGQVIIAMLMIAVIAFIMVMIISEPLVDEITNARNATNLNCTNPNLASTTKATCVIMDMGLFYFISVAIASGLALLSGKRTLTGILTTIFVFVAVTVMITPLKDLIVLIRDSSHLNCGAAGITVGANMACIFVDIWLFYFVVLAIAGSISYIFAKKVYPKITGEEE